MTPEPLKDKRRTKIEQLEDIIYLAFLELITRTGNAMKKISENSVLNFFIGMGISEYFFRSEGLNIFGVMFGLMFIVYFFYMCAIFLMKTGIWGESIINEIETWRKKEQQGKKHTVKQVLNWLVKENEDKDTKKN